MESQSAIMTLEKSPELLHAEAEARRYCDEYGITDLDECSKIAEQYARVHCFRDMVPLHEMAAQVLGSLWLEQPKFIQQDGVLTQIHPQLSDLQKQIMKNIDEMKAAIAKRYGLSLMASA